MKLVWSQQAKRDIQEIIDYYNQVAGIGVSRKIVQKIYEYAQCLVTNPREGQCELLLVGNPKEYRRVIVGNHKIIYRIDGDTVYVSTVFDTRRNPAALDKIL